MSGAGVIGRDAISNAIRAASAKGDPALVAFLTAGYPSKEKFRQHLQAVVEGYEAANEELQRPCLKNSTVA